MLGPGFRKPSLVGPEQPLFILRSKSANRILTHLNIDQMELIYLDIDSNQIEKNGIAPVVLFCCCLLFGTALLLSPL
jgi:hypothetical protein